MTLCLEPLKVSYHPTKFGGHIYCDSGEVKIISQAHVMKQ